MIVNKNEENKKDGSYEVTLETLTPVFIGSGNELIQLDYFYDNGFIYVVDFDELAKLVKDERGEDFKKVLDIAKRDYGINIENKNPAELEKQHQEMYKNQEELKIINQATL